MKTTGFTREDIVTTTQAVVNLGRLAMEFGRVDRTCVAHPDGTPESDSDHTVMLSWIAPPLAEIINLRSGYERFPVGKVTQFCVVHDAPEVYAGDTPTHKITAEEYAVKEAKENEAARRLYLQFAKSLPWFARLVTTYEAQVDPCARFVRSVDKIMPKIVHVINAGEDLRRAHMSEDDFRALYLRQRAQVEEWCPEPLLLQIYDELCYLVLQTYEAQHYFQVYDSGHTTITHPPECFDLDDLLDCPFEAARRRFMEVVCVPLVTGKYPVKLTDSMLEFYS